MIYNNILFMRMKYPEVVQVIFWLAADLEGEFKKEDKAEVELCWQW